MFAVHYFILRLQRTFEDVEEIDCLLHVYCLKFVALFGTKCLQHSSRYETNLKKCQWLFIYLFIYILVNENHEFLLHQTFYLNYYHGFKIKLKKISLTFSYRKITLFWVREIRHQNHTPILCSNTHLLIKLQKFSSSTELHSTIPYTNKIINIRLWNEFRFNCLKKINSILNNIM